MLRYQEYIAEVLYGESYDDLTLVQQADVDAEIAFRFTLGWAL